MVLNIPAANDAQSNALCPTRACPSYLPLPYPGLLHVETPSRLVISLRAPTHHTLSASGGAAPRIGRSVQLPKLTAVLGGDGGATSDPGAGDDVVVVMWTWELQQRPERPMGSDSTKT